MARTAKSNSKLNRKRKVKVRKSAKAELQESKLVAGGIDWVEEIELLFTDLARELCDTPDKCKMLVVRVTLRDGSEYLISGHGKRVVSHDGTQEIVCMHFLGQDAHKRRVALSVRPDDVFKIELVDVPELEERPPFGFATKILRDQLATLTQPETKHKEGVSNHAN